MFFESQSELKVGLTQTAVFAPKNRNATILLIEYRI